jgi:carbon-monoxide dehydrogenase small subunit
MKHQVKLTVNGEPKEAMVEPRRTLLDMLRYDLGLTGSKKCCDEGDCGLCTVFLDGTQVTSCLVLAVAANGKNVITVEGLSSGVKLHPVQQAFVDKWGLQCGFCTPGMIMSAVALLRENPNPSVEEIKWGLAGNLCRCTGYVQIIEAVQAAAKVMQEEAKV